MDVPTNANYNLHAAAKPATHERTFGKTSAKKKGERAGTAGFPAHTVATAWMAGLQGFFVFALLMACIVRMAQSGVRTPSEELSTLLTVLPCVLEVSILSIAVFLIMQKARLDRMNGWGVLALHGVVFGLVVGGFFGAHLPPPAAASMRLVQRSAPSSRRPVERTAKRALRRLGRSSSQQYWNSRRLAQRADHF
ncbi:MAG: hypothetical protein M3Y56_03530, partial [Armatimonadota bacterium]|nr:hypothetical protein [Armatimonadota bacterium]